MKDQTSKHWKYQYPVSVDKKDKGGMTSQFKERGDGFRERDEKNKINKTYLLAWFFRSFS